jgi:peroxiredoxin Q/BCP
MFDWLFSPPLAVGSPAPDFTLPDQEGNPVSLSLFRGKNVILVFYPADDTTVCTKQLCEFRERWPQVLEKNAAVFGVNPGTPSSHAKFRTRNDLPFALLVDAGQKVGRLYHTRSFVPRRTVYLIDPNGVIRFAERGKPDPELVLAAAC